MTQAATRRIAASTRKPLASFGLRAVGKPDLGITSGLPVIRPQLLAGDGELRAAGLTRPVIELNPDLRMRVVSTPGMRF
jgi:hypothetical protein